MVRYHIVWVHLFRLNAIAFHKSLLSTIATVNLQCQPDQKKGIVEGQTLSDLSLSSFDRHRYCFLMCYGHAERHLRRVTSGLGTFLSQQSTKAGRL